MLLFSCSLTKFNLFITTYRHQVPLCWKHQDEKRDSTVKCLLSYRERETEKKALFCFSLWTEMKEFMHGDAEKTQNTNNFVCCGNLRLSRHKLFYRYNGAFIVWKQHSKIAVARLLPLGLVAVWAPHDRVTHWPPRGSRNVCLSVASVSAPYTECVTGELQPAGLLGTVCVCRRTWNRASQTKVR